MTGFTDDIPRAGGGKVLDALSDAQHLPVEALERAVRNPARIADPVLALLARAAEGEDLSEREQNLLFWGVHALAAAGETRLCASLLRLLRRNDDRALDLLGDAITGTMARVVVSVFDGDTDALLEAVADRDADGYARWALFGAVSRLVFDGRIDRDRVQAFLHRFDDERLARGGDTAWSGWEEAIALGGFADLAERVAAARRDARLLDEVSDPEWFAATLAEAVASPSDATRFDAMDLGPVTDVVAELEDALASDEDGEPEEPVQNPNRHVGRNDPCPCGSGKKYKKCCLAP